MLKPSFEQDRAYLWQKFRSPEFDASTGMEYEALKKELTGFDEKYAGFPLPVIKALAFEYLAEHLRIEIDPHDFFPSFECWNRKKRPLSGLLKKFMGRIEQKMETRELKNLLTDTGSSNIWIDFDHSVPDWSRIFSLGFPGLLDEVVRYREKHRAAGTLDTSAAAFFDGVEITCRAVLHMLDRLVDRARVRGGSRAGIEAAALERLRAGTPQNFYDALLLIYLYFMFSEHFDRLQVRSLGNLDNLLLPYFESDLKNGTFTEAEMRELFDYFLMQWASIDNYWGHPFYLGGTADNGSSRINRLSFLILEEFNRLSIPTPKIQLKIARNTPDEFIDSALRMIRRGNNSLVFVGEEGIERAMTRIGVSPEDARDCDIYGCYEFAPRGVRNATNTLCGFLNMLKPFELIFNGGRDRRTGQNVGPRPPALSELRTFGDFCRAYLDELQWIIDQNILTVNEFETHLNEINPANLFSATISHSLESARDAFHNGSFYNNTIFQNAGFGSAVDSLAVIRELVYRRREVDINTLGTALNADWQGFEKLHRTILNFPGRYGNGVRPADRIAAMLARFVGDAINGRPNGRGGIWLASAHSARQFLDEGKLTGATPDGRFSGEEMSKNASPVMGMDTAGVTALIRSAIAVDSACFPGDFPLDVMMHPSSVSGDDGLVAWRRLIRTYLENNGLAIHFNIFDSGVLKEAQKHPEKYRGLQVRVCGWNVRFTEMSPREQNMYIRRAENIAT